VKFKPGVGPDRAAGGLDRRDAPARRLEAGDRDVLVDPATVVLQRPGVGLNGPLRIGVAAEVQVEAAYRVVADDGHQLPELLRVQRLRPEAALGGDLRAPAVEGELRDSLFASMERLGESAALTAKLVSLFEWDFDFAAESLPGDRFRLLVEKRYADGAFVGYGDILIAQYASAGRAALTSLAFEDTQGQTAQAHDVE